MNLCYPRLTHTFTRRTILGSILVAPLVLSPRRAAGAKHRPHVLFVCQFGSVKSPISRELFRSRAAERGIAVIAASRGVQPEAHLDQQLRARLAAQGIDPGRDGLHKLGRSDLRQADYTVLLDLLPTGWHGRNVRDWTDLGSFNQSYATEEPRVKARIEALLDEIAAR